METRQQELYSSVLSEAAVVDWGNLGPGEEWVNSGAQEGEQGVSRGLTAASAQRGSNGDEAAQVFQNGERWTRSAAALAGEAGETSAAGEDRWGPTSDRWVMSDTWDMELDGAGRGRFTAGFLDSDPLREADEDTVSEVNLNNSIMTEEEREEIQQELAKLEEEISTLRQVLAAKEKQHAELKQKLGITPLSEFRNNFSRGWQDVQSSVAYKKTSETLSTAGQKTSAALSTLGSTITKKFGDMSYSIKHSMSMPTMRNSPSFKSFEEKVESTVSTIKTKVGTSGSGGSFEDVLSSAAAASTQDTPTNDLTDMSERES